MKIVVLVLMTTMVIGTAIWLKSGKTPKTVEKSATGEMTKVVGKVIPEVPQLPVYPGAKPESSYKKEDNGKTGYAANWNTNDAVTDVMKWYLENLPQNGWSPEITPENLNLGELQALFKKDGHTLYLTIEREDKEFTEIHAEFPLR